MKIFPLPFSVLALAGLAFWAGCSTPTSRIREQPALFASLAPADQEKVKSGQVAVGFTPDVVKLALGDPDRVWVRTDSNGSNEVWTYVTYESDTGLYLYRGYYHRSFRSPDVFFPYYLSYDNRRERDEIRIQFKDGLVSVIEQRSRK